MDYEYRTAECVCLYVWDFFGCGTKDWGFLGYGTSKE